MLKRWQLAPAAVVLIVSTLAISSHVSAASDRPPTSFISRWEPSDSTRVIRGPMTKSMGMKISAITIHNIDTVIGRPRFAAITTASSSSCSAVSDKSSSYQPLEVSVRPGETLHLTYPSVLDLAHPDYYGPHGDAYWCLIFYGDDGVDTGVTVVGP